MEIPALRAHRFRNALQSLLLAGSMGGLCAYLAWLLGGAPMAAGAAAAVLLLYFLNPALSPRLVLRLFRGRALALPEAPELYAAVAELARRAELPAVPRLYYLPTDVMNAFTTGTARDAAIALSDGLLRRLSLRELVGVLAHEITHVRNRDIRLMGFADLVARLTSVLSSAGLLLLFVNMPLLLFTGAGIPWLPVLLLLAAPSISALVQLALSRSREYEADLGAVALTGDPVGLAAALGKMERYQGRVLEQILLPGQRLPDPSLLRTHPPTGERIRRLLALRADRPALALADAGAREGWPVAAVPLRPRWHRSGLWY
jgi:heat shock protein HtpX